MNSVILKRDLDNILSNHNNVIVTTGIVGGSSIEIEFVEQQSFESYPYNSMASRDNDLNELVTLLTKKNG